ncbi:hypothetical protein [Rhodopila sp.]|uniref:hypothetical protein n=1 Tax=Rhodopila sp. TaxID=2480087 RepID=UPI003D0F6BA6
MPIVPPTLLSTFEVLFTPQFPPGLGPTTVQKADELAIKGFFLTLANINSAPFTFDIGFHCNVNPAGPPVPQRTLANATAFLDDGVTGVPLTFTANPNGVDFSLRVTVNARGTVLVGVLPQIFLGSTLPTANVEIRGWVDLRLPALIKRHFPFFFEPQSQFPVPIIATPEQRITFLPLPTDAATAVEAQTAFALPSASGHAELQIPPQPGGPIIVFPKPEQAEISAADARLLESVSPETLSALMSGVAAGESGGRQVHKVKEKA